MKNKQLIIILVILLTIAGIYYFSNTKGTLNLKHSSFAIDSPEKISKIQISGSQQDIVLSKEYQHWKVNSKYNTTEKSVENLILALNRVVVLSPVSKAEKEQISSLLRADGLLVKVFNNRRLIREFYVSKPAMNDEKTYMMMKKSSDPFIVKIPAFKGQLADLFIVDETYWRNKTVFDYQPQNIKSIKLEYPNVPEKSFKLINYSDGTFAIQDLSKNKPVEDFNVDKVARYFTYYQRIVFEDVVNGLKQTAIDSVLHSDPYCIISVEDINESTNKITIYRKPSEKELDEFGQKIRFDYNRAYATFNNNQELITIQYYIFDPLFKEINYFR